MDCLLAKLWLSDLHQSRIVDSLQMRQTAAPVRVLI